MNKWIAAAVLLVLTTTANAAPDAVQTATGPAFDCAAVEPGSIEALICADPQLASLDRKLASIYSAASTRATNEQPPLLKAEQRGWIKGRNDCWKSDDQRKCVEDGYVYRIAELQARYRLVPAIGPVRFTCNGNPADEIIVTHFRTEPQTMIAERGDSVSLMYIQPSASGSKYQGRNESFWEHHGEARVTWGYDAPEIQCKQAQTGSE